MKGRISSTKGEQRQRKKQQRPQAFAQRQQYQERKENGNQVLAEKRGKEAQSSQHPIAFSVLLPGGGVCPMAPESAPHRGAIPPGGKPFREWRRGRQLRLSILGPGSGNNRRVHVFPASG